jgi:hypothetical protein
VCSTSRRGLVGPGRLDIGATHYGLSEAVLSRFLFCCPGFFEGIRAQLSK